MLAGHLPYEVSDSNVVEAARVIQEQPPKTLGSSDRRLKGDMETIVAKALAKEPRHRYSSAAELADDIRRYLRGEAITARPPSLRYQLQVFTRRNRVPVAAAAVALISLVVGVIGTTSGWMRANRERAHAATGASYVAEINLVYDPRTTVPGNTDDALLAEVADWVKAGSLASQPKLEATLLTTIGNTYSQIGQTKDACRCLQEALIIRRRLYPHDSLEVADSLHDLAAASYEFDTDALFRDSIEIRRGILGNDHPDTIRSLSAFAFRLRFPPSLSGFAFRLRFPPCTTSSSFSILPPKASRRSFRFSRSSHEISGVSARLDDVAEIRLKDVTLPS